MAFIQTRVLMALCKMGKFCRNADKEHPVILNFRPGQSYHRKTNLANHKTFRQTEEPFSKTHLILKISFSQVDEYDP